MTSPFGLQPADVTAVMHRFGVAEAQACRDHTISHILAALSRYHRDDVICFGGTALSRTYLLDERPSEDIDLLATGDRDRLAGTLARTITMALARTHGRIRWAPTWSANSDVAPAVAITPQGIAVRMQLLRPAAYVGWPTALRDVAQPYPRNGVRAARSLPGGATEPGGRPGEALPGSTWRGVTLGVNIATTGAVDEAFETALGAGVTSVARPVQREWGGYSGYIAEPEGNRWEITWAPCAWRRIPRA
jgi:hypothetical protein